MKQALVIAVAELQLMMRSRVASMGLASLVALSVVAAASSWAHVQAERDLRLLGQEAADHDFDSQPDRHPHRMVHYGHYAFRPISALAAFDPGVDALTGTVIFLEGHRQNSATFGEARESSSLMRFGLLTPAFVLQTLAPLLLIFLGFACVSRERENQSLRLMYAHGANNFSVLLGKFLALGVVAGIAFLPALVGLGWAIAVEPSEYISVLLITLGYAIYLLTWCKLIIIVSSLVRHSRFALINLFGLWVLTTLLMPRLAAEVANSSIKLPARAETELEIHAELRKIGDSHNPNDPFFSKFRDDLLKKHGVERIEDLPFNYRGALSKEGEALTSKLFASYAEKNAELQKQQFDILQLFSLGSPALAVRRASMAMAASDLDNHLAFLRQSEAYRYDMVQRLNQMHADKLTFADDIARSTSTTAEARTRISSDNWQTIPDFQFVPSSITTRVQASLSAFGWLILWWLGAWIGLAIANRRLESNP